MHGKASALEHTSPYQQHIGVDANPLLRTSSEYVAHLADLLGDDWVHHRRVGPLAGAAGAAIA